MADRPTLITVSSGSQYDTDTLNENFTKLRDVFDDVLGRAGTSGNNNTMQGDLDMGGYSIRNASFLDVVTGATEAVATISDLRALTSDNDLNLVVVKGHTTINDGGGGLFVYHPSDTSSADDNGIIIVDAAGRRWKRLYDNAINVRWFGATGDNSTDDTLPIQKAIDTAGAYDTVFVPLGIYISTSVITIDKPINFIMDGYLRPNHSGIGIYINRIGLGSGGNQSQSNTLVLRLDKHTVDHSDGSIGIHLGACYASTLYINLVRGFETGVKATGSSDGGFVYNTVFWGRLHNNKIQFHEEPPSSSANGWVNQNTYIGGRFHYSPGEVNGATGRTGYVQYKTGGASNNNNTWINPSFEDTGIELAGGDEWQPNTAYSVNDKVWWLQNRYICTSSGTSGSSTSSAPTGTGSGISDGTVTWDFEGVERAKAMEIGSVHLKVFGGRTEYRGVIHLTGDARNNFIQLGAYVTNDYVINEGTNNVIDLSSGRYTRNSNNAGRNTRLVSSLSGDVPLELVNTNNTGWGQTISLGNGVTLPSIPNAASGLIIHKDNNTGLCIVSTTTGTCNIYFGDTDSAAVGRLVYDNNTNEMQIFTAGSQRLTIRGQNVYLGDTSAPFLRSGSGTPEGSVSGPVGSLYLRTDGGAGTSLYVKESGAGNTGWVAK